MSLDKYFMKKSEIMQGLKEEIEDTMNDIFEDEEEDESFFGEDGECSEYYEPPSWQLNRAEEFEEEYSQEDEFAEEEQEEGEEEELPQDEKTLGTFIGTIGDVKFYQVERVEFPFIQKMRDIRKWCGMHKGGQCGCTHPKNLHYGLCVAAACPHFSP